VWTEASDPDQGTWVAFVSGGDPVKVSDWPTRVVWDRRSGALLQLRRSDDSIELWQAERSQWRWRKRSTLDLGARPQIQLEYMPLTVDPVTGRLVVNRRSGTASLIVFDGVDVNRW
jgi:hypothetical protein